MTTIPVYQAIQQQDGSLVVELHGEIDEANAWDVEVLLLSSLDAGESRIVVDLAGVSFMASSGLKLSLSGITPPRRAPERSSFDHHRSES